MFVKRGERTCFARPPDCTGPNNRGQRVARGIDPASPFLHHAQIKHGQIKTGKNEPHGPRSLSDMNPIPRRKNMTDTTKTCDGIPRLCCFCTPLGWLGLLGLDERLIATFVGHAAQESIVNAAMTLARTTNIRMENWTPPLRSDLEDYAAGKPVQFDAVDLSSSGTLFQRKITELTRKIPYGQTVSYGELARRAGHPRAARAVGTVMSHNRFPILIPCHRVLAAGGKLGGYTAPCGTEFKKRLLTLESQALGQPNPIDD